MIAAAEGHYLLPASVPTVLIVAGAVAGLAAWVSLHFLKARLAGRADRTLRALMLALRVVVGFATGLAIAQALMRVLVLATNWDLWPMALGAALGIEVVVAVYGLERQTISRRASLALAGLRAVLVALVVLMLTQPARSLQLQEKIRRCLAILIDDSASMFVSDTQLTAAEKVRLAEMLSVVEARRPCRLDVVYRRLEKVRQMLLVEGDWLRSSPEGDRARQMAEARDKLLQRMTEAQKTVSDQAAALAAMESAIEDESALTALRDAKGALGGLVLPRLLELTQLLQQADSGKPAPPLEELAKRMVPSAEELGRAGARLAAAAEKLDTDFYRSLSRERREKIDEVARKPRVELAREILLRPPVDPAAGPAGDSLLQRLREKYDVRIYRFARDCSPVDLEQFARDPGALGIPAPTTRPSTQPAELPAEQQHTDLTGAMEKAMSNVPASEDLAGMLILSDGRHNAARRPEEPAGKLAMQGVPVCSVLLGSQRPPKDAGFVSLDSPQTVYLNDKLYVTVEVKLDGMAGQSARVVLYDGDKQVDSRIINVPQGADRFRKKEQLVDEPKEKRLHGYRMVLENPDPNEDPKVFPGEVITTNNEYPFTVSATDEKTKLLVVEGRPRWEFRYLKNLFADRDVTVKLQYVLLEPDQIAGRTERPKIPASATRPAGEAEATVLPGHGREPLNDEEVVREWLKFDVIVLGDVDPNRLRPVDREALRRFVHDQGGKLIVIAGPQFMPRSYAGTPLAEVLPVVLDPTLATARQAPAPTSDPNFFRIALTPEGREGPDGIIMRQAADPNENQTIWNSTAEIYWPFPLYEARGAARVLAYANPAEPNAPVPSPAASGTREEQLARQVEFERKHALITLQKVGLGEVLYLGFDRTWRLRYREGDRLHHKFWGQVLRWATADKLPVGTELVKIGTTRTRYDWQTPVVVKARLLDPNFAPVESNQVYVNVFRGQQLVMRQQLVLEPNSAGRYSTSIEQLPSGSYRYALEFPKAAEVYPSDQVQAIQGLSSDFSVDPFTSVEQVELDPDRGLLSGLAGLTRGVQVEPAQAGEVLGALGEDTQIRREPPRQYSLWDSWPLLVLIVLIATVEWVIRKKVGLP
jgi:hypothetical protein